MSNPNPIPTGNSEKILIYAMEGFENFLSQPTIHLIQDNLVTISTLITDLNKVCRHSPHDISISQKIGKSNPNPNPF